ncbi:MAG: hypothetical protein FJ291_11350 [Planctomycetes bacterium]|nr:hypothetical protein [Planctomycetota bacterium]
MWRPVSLLWGLCLCGLAAPPLASAAERTAKITLMALGDNRVADLDALTGRYGLMIASANVGQDVIAAFRQRNPGALVFCYVNTSDINADSAKYPYYARIWTDTNAHEDWFHHDAAGARVRIYYPKYKNRCAFNTGKPGLQQYLAGLVVETLKTGRYDGIQLDNVSTEFPFRLELAGKWISAPPVDLTPAQWTADEVALLKAIMKAVADAGLKEKKIIFNHMRSGEPQESRAYVEVTDGANCESWMSLRTGLEGRWGWKAKVEQVREANRKGKLTNLLCIPQFAEAFGYKQYHHDRRKMPPEIPDAFVRKFGEWCGEPDKFITADLSKGRMVEVVERGEPAIIVSHWTGIYFNGEEEGFKTFQEAVRRLQAKYGRLIWMKLSEIARYWAAKELTQIESGGGGAPAAGGSHTGTTMEVTKHVVLLLAISVAGCSLGQTRLARDQSAKPANAPDRGQANPRRKATMRIGAAQPRSRLIDWRLKPAEALAQADKSLGELEQIVHKAALKDVLPGAVMAKRSAATTR